MDSEKDEKNINSDEPQENLEGQDEVSQEAPADALSRTPEDLEEEKSKSEDEADTAEDEEAAKEKKLSPLKKFFRKVNIYFLSFILITVVAAAIAIVSYINSHQEPAAPNVANQELTEEALRQLANTDASVGNSSQTLTIQGNAVITGQSLMRGNLNVAGNIQTGGSLQAPSITISGSTNLNDTQISSLQVANNAAIQGSTTMRDLSVTGASTFSGAMTASQITVTRLIMSGNASLEIPNHISFTGPVPSRSVDTGILGTGSSSSISGSDTAGTINVNSGNNPTAGCFVKITFNQAFSRQPRVTVTPVGAPAGQLQFYVERNNSSFSICSNNAPAPSRSFGFDYFVTY